MYQPKPRINSSLSAGKNSSSFFRSKHHRDAPFFQPKLILGQEDDGYEKEADAVADQVTRATGSGSMLHSTQTILPLQRSCAECENEESFARQKESASSTGQEKKFETPTSIPLVHAAQTPHKIQRAIKVDPAVNLDTMGFHVARTGDTYSSNVVTKDSVWNEIISSLFFSPRVFRVRGSTSGEANRNFRAHLKARYDIITFASKRAYGFGAGAGFTINEDLWVVDPVTKELDVKPGVNPQKAREDLNAHPEKYAIACEAATKITMLGGSKSEKLRGDYGNADDDWIPGDWGWIENINYPQTGGIPGREGENLIYVGQDMFWGHTTDKNSYRTYDQWFELVNNWNNGGAELKDWRNYPINGLI